MPNNQPDDRREQALNRDDKGKKGVETVTRNLKAKNARLRLLKERHENYLAEQREDNAEADLTEELRASGAE